MQGDKIYIQGLDLHSDAHSAQPGACSLLENMYPSGDPKAPVWKRVTESASKLLQTVNCPFLWTTDGATPKLVYVTDGWTTRTWSTYVAYRDIDIDTLAIGSTESILVSSSGPLLTEASYAQIGNALVICTNSDGVYVAGNNNGTPYAIPLNMPNVPEIDIHWDRTHTYTRELGGSPQQEVPNSWYGLRWGWELIDGTIVGISSTKPRVMDHLDNARIGFAFRFVNSYEKNPYPALVRGIAVYMTATNMEKPVEGKYVGQDNTFAVAQYHKIGTITKFGEHSTEFVLEYNYLKTEHLTLPIYDEDNLLIHKISAASVSSYNKAAILLGAKYDYLRPLTPLGKASSVDGSTNLLRAYEACIVVELAINGRLYTRNSDAVDVAVGTGLEVGYLSYPDRNVSKFTLWYNYGGTLYNKEMAPAVAEKSNFSYVNFNFTGDYKIWRDEAAPHDAWRRSGFVNVGSLTLPADSRETPDSPGRILVSQSLRPFDYRAGSAQYVGNDVTDRVVAVASNALPISAGQFGQYPLYVFCERSIWAARVGTDVMFSSLAPVAINRGIKSRDCVINADNVIYYACADGVHSIPAAETSVSYKIEPYILSQIDEYSKLHYYRDSATGRRELWLQCGNPKWSVVDNGWLIITPGITKMYAYAIDYAKWFTINNEVGCSAFCNVGQKSVGVLPGVSMKLARTDSEKGSVVALQSSTPKVGQATLVPLTFGDVGILKRLRRMILRKLGADDVYVSGPKSEYAFTVDLSDIEYDIECLEAEAEARYMHRPKLRREVTVGLDAGDGRTHSGWIGYGKRYGKNYGHGI